MTPDELSGGTFTITNFGSAGALIDTPIIVPPQVAMLGTGALVKRPRVIFDPLGKVIAVREVMYLSLSYDHRLIDGADAARFLTTLKRGLRRARSAPSSASDHGRSTDMMAGRLGLLGPALVTALRVANRVVRLVRRAPANLDGVHWDPQAGVRHRGVRGVDVAVNLWGRASATNDVTRVRAAPARPGSPPQVTIAAVVEAGPQC